MSSNRRNILDDIQPLDTSDFQVKPAQEKPIPPKDQLRAISEAANFPDRDTSRPANTPPITKRRGRLYTTGRNIGFACKATKETYDAIYDIADQQQWKVAEVLEQAIAALQRELASKN
jgi:hypothetical protein